MLLKPNKTEQINETRCWFFETIKKTNKSLASLMNKKKERTQINKSRMKEITTNTAEIKTIIREYYEQ